MVDSDHEVRIESENCDGGMAVHEMTGSVTKFVRRDNVFEVKRYVMPYSQSPWDEAGFFVNHAATPVSLLPLCRLTMVVRCAWRANEASRQVVKTLL